MLRFSWSGDALHSNKIPAFYIFFYLTVISLSRRFSNSYETQSSAGGGGTRNGSDNMDNNSRDNKGSNKGSNIGIDIGQFDTQARGNILLRWLKDSCKDDRLFALQIQYQLFQRLLNNVL